MRNARITLENERATQDPSKDESPAMRSRRRDEAFLRELDELLAVIDPGGTVSGRFQCSRR